MKYQRRELLYTFLSEVHKFCMNLLEFHLCEELIVGHTYV